LRIWQEAKTLFGQTVLWLSACLFYREDSIAGLLLLPTCVWVTVAGALNWTIHILNSE
jgi:tryptophan-rich sensory protein